MSQKVFIPTDGPWSVCKGTNDLAIYGGNNPRPSSGAIARVRIPSGLEETAASNARLIASAPHLLAALRRLVVDAAGPHDPAEWSPSRPYQVAIDAIVRATGEHPFNVITGVQA